MANLFKKYKWMVLILGTLLIVAGVVTIIVACVNLSALTTTLSIIIAVTLFIFGGFAILSSFLDDVESFFSPALAYGSIMIAVGVVLCIMPNLIGEIIVNFVAVFAIAFGVVELIKGIFLIKYHAKPSWFIACFVIGAICIAGGIVALCVDRSGVLQVIYIVVGSMFCIAGIIETIYGIKLLQKGKTEIE